MTCAPPGTAGFVAATDGLAITVVPAATVIDDGTQGIAINNASSVVNNGTIVADTAASSGVLINLDNNSVINNNTITVTINATQGFGIQSLGTNNTIINNSTINLRGAQSIGISGGTSDTITNNGTVNVLSGASQAIGILGFGGNSNVITNASTGLITVAANSGVGILTLTNNDASNNGKITATGAGSFGMAVTTSTNNGLITASGNPLAGPGGFSSAGMLILGSTGTNSAIGQIVASGLGSVGLGAVSLLGPSTAINNGLIVASGNSALGMAGGSPFGPNPILINNGTIIASGPNSVAVASNGAYSSLVPVPGFGLPQVFYSNADFTNNGVVQAIGTNAFALRTDSGAQFHVINNGTIDGRVLIDFTGFGSANSLTNNGLLTKSTGPFAESLISGDFTQTAGGTYAPRVSPDTTVAGYDRLRVEQDTFGGSVAATIGGTLKAVVQPGLYAQTQTYASVFQYCTCSADELTTRFASVVSSSPFFAASVTYVDNLLGDGLIDSVNLTLTRIGFGAVPGATPNERAVGNALEGAYSTTLTGNAATFYGNLLAATSVSALDQLSGEGTSAAQNAAFGAGSQFNGAMQNQGLFDSSLGGVSVTIPATQYADSQVARGHEAFASLKTESDVAQPGRWRIWSAGFAASHALQGEVATGSSSQSIRNFGARSASITRSRPTCWSASPPAAASPASR